MKKKIIGIFVGMLLIVVTISSVLGIIDKNEMNNMKTDEHNNLIKQVIESGVISNDYWFEQDKLLPSDGEEDDEFGNSVSISGDTAIIGVIGDSDNGIESGSAYIFTRSGTVWTQQAKLLASDGSTEDYFGISVSINGDYTIIGAYGSDDNGDWIGSAYIFTRNGTVWTQQAKLLASDGEEMDQFGYSVSISGDSVIVGTRFDDDNGDKSGSAYIFTRSGTVWTQQAKLLASDGGVDDKFGWSVSIDGDSAIIGAVGDCDNGVWAGAAYIFIRSGSVWTEQQKLLASDGEDYADFGFSVSISGDYAVIGAKDDEESGYDSGAAYIFIRSGSVWTEQTKLIASDGAKFDKFGWSVSIDGDSAIIGAIRDYDNGIESGSAYIFIKTAITTPDLDCNGSISWTGVTPRGTVSSRFTVENIGEVYSLLDWEIESYPNWGTWTFSPDSGIDLHAGEGITINLEVKAPNEPEKEFEGEIVLVNCEDPDDICSIDVALATPVSQSIQQSLLQRLLERFPHAFPILRNLL